jgi:hypothetical protein
MSDEAAPEVTSDEAPAETTDHPTSDGTVVVAVKTTLASNQEKLQKISERITGIKARLGDVLQGAGQEGKVTHKLGGATHVHGLLSDQSALLTELVRSG